MVSEIPESPLRQIIPRHLNLATKKLEYKGLEELDDYARISYFYEQSLKFTVISDLKHFFEQAVLAKTKEEREKNLEYADLHIEEYGDMMFEYRIVIGNIKMLFKAWRDLPTNMEVRDIIIHDLEYLEK